METKIDEPTRAGELWTSGEDSDLLAAFDEGRSLVDLAIYMRRTKAAVVARLVRNEKLIEVKGAYIKAGPVFVLYKDLLRK